MREFTEGRRVAKVGCYGPADTEFDEAYWEMAVTMEDGDMAAVPWIRATSRKTGEVVMLNCAKCACITFWKQP